MRPWQRHHPLETIRRATAGAVACTLTLTPLIAAPAALASTMTLRVQDIAESPEQRVGLEEAMQRAGNQGNFRGGVDQTGGLEEPAFSRRELLGAGLVGAGLGVAAFVGGKALWDRLAAREGRIPLHVKAVIDRRRLHSVRQWWAWSVRYVDDSPTSAMEVFATLGEQPVPFSLYIYLPLWTEAAARVRAALAQPGAFIRVDVTRVSGVKSLTLGTQPEDPRVIPASVRVPATTIAPGDLDRGLIILPVRVAAGVKEPTTKGEVAVGSVGFTLKATLVVPKAGLEEAATAGAPVAPVEITPVETFLESLTARGLTLTEASEAQVAVAMAEAIAHGTPLEVAALLPLPAPAPVPTTVHVYTPNPAWVGLVDGAVKGWTLPGPDSASPTIFSAALYTGPAAVEYPAVAVRTEQEAPIPGLANFVVANPAEVGRLGQDLVSLAAAAHERLAGQTIPATAVVLKVTDKKGKEYLAALL